MIINFVILWGGKIVVTKYVLRIDNDFGLFHLKRSSYINRIILSYDLKSIFFWLGEVLLN